MAQPGSAQLVTFEMPSRYPWTAFRSWYSAISDGQLHLTVRTGVPIGSTGFTVILVVGGVPEVEDVVDELGDFVPEL